MNPRPGPVDLIPAQNLGQAILQADNMRATPSWPVSLLESAFERLRARVDGHPPGLLDVFATLHEGPADGACALCSLMLEGGNLP